MTPSHCLGSDDSANQTNREFFICRRNPEQHQGDKWEFPGGKIDANETPLDALKRELKEEIDIDVKEAKPLLNISFDYPEKRVCLHVFIVTDFIGTAKGAEGQESKWVAAKQLSTHTFPDANTPILDSLKTKGYL